MEDRSQILYQKLLEKGLYSKTYDDFVSQFSDETKRTKLHEALVGKGLYSKGVEDFNAQFFGDIKKKEPFVEGSGPLLPNAAEQSSPVASPSESTKLSPIEEAAEQYYTDKGWPSPKKKIFEFKSGVADIQAGVVSGVKTPDQAKLEAIDLANKLALVFNPETGDISVSQAEMDMYHEQLDRSYYQNLKDKAKKEKEGFLKDVFDNLNIGAHSVMAAPTRLMAISERLGNALVGLIDKKNKLSSTYWSDKAAIEANLSDQWAQNNQRYDANIAELIQSGDMAAAAGQTVMSIAENLPLLTTLALGNGAGLTHATLGFMGADKSADDYLRSVSTENIPEVARIINAVGKGLSEVVFEDIGTVSILNSVRKGISEAGQKTLRDQLIQSYTPLFQRQLTLLSKGTSAMIREGGSEMATQLTDNMFDIAVGRDIKLMDGVWDSGIVGAVIGGGMTSPQMLAEYKGGKSEFVKQITKNIPDNIDIDQKVELAELLIESAQLKYDQGKKIAGTDAVNKVRLDEIQTRVGEILGKPTEMPKESGEGQQAKAPGEQQTKITEEQKNAESVGIKTEEAGAEKAPGMEQGEEGGVHLRNAPQDRLETKAGEVVRSEDGDIAQMAAPIQSPPTSETQAAAIEEIKRLNGLSKGQVVIPVNDAGTLPGFNKIAAEKFKVSPSMRALHIKGDTRSYINIDRITSVDDARRAWLHEAGIHGGIERLFPTKEEYTSTMFGVLNNLGGREAAIAKIIELGGNEEAYRSQTDAMVAEEYLAFLSRKIITDPNLSAEKVLAPDELSWWQKFIKTIKEAIAKTFGTAIDMTDADIANLIIDATQTGMSEAGRKTETVFKGRETSMGEMMAEAVAPEDKTSIYVAPYRVSQVENLEDKSAFEDKGYQQLRKEVDDIAKTMGFEGQETQSFIGGYSEYNEETGETTRSQEPSIKIDVPASNVEDVDLMSALLGVLAPETQNSVMQVFYGEGKAGTMSVVTVKNAVTAEKITSRLQNLGFSFDNTNNILYLASQNAEEYKQILTILNDNSDGITEIKRQGADINFFMEGGYREALSKFKDSGRYRSDEWKDLSAYVDKALAKFEGEKQEVTAEAAPEPSPRAKKLKDIIRAQLIRPAPSEQKRIDEAYKIGAAEGKRAEKEAKSNYKDFSKKIATVLREADFKNNLTDFQARTLVNAARRVTDEQSLNKFLDVVDRVVENREYKDQMDSAKAQQKAIRNRTRDGKNAYGADAEAVWNFASLPLRYEDFSIEALKEYNRIAGLLLQGRVPADGVVAVKSYVPPEISEAKTTGAYNTIKNIKDREDFDGVIEKLRGMDITSVRDYRKAMRLADAVKARLDELADLDADVVEEMYNDLENFTDAMDNIGGEIEAMIEEEKIATIDAMADMKELVNPDDFNYAEMKAEVKRFLNIDRKDLMLMSPKQIRLYAQIMDGLTQGFVNKEMPQFMDAVGQLSMETIWEKIQNKLEGEQFAKRKAFFDKLGRMRMGWLARFMEPLMLGDNVYLTNYISLRNLGSVDEKVLGMGREGSEKVERPTYEKYVMPIVRAIQQAERATTIAVNNYWDVARKVSKNNRMLAGILMVEKDFRSNPIVIAEGEFKGEYTWETLPTEEKKDLMRWALTQYADARIDLTELSKHRDQLVMDEDGNIDIEASIKKISAKDKNFVKLMDISRQIFDEHKGKARFAAEMRGVIFGDEGPNYTPRIVRQDNVGRGDSEFSIDHIDKMFSPFAAIRKRAKATYERTHGRFVVEYNLDNIVGMHIMDVNRDFYLSRPLGVANRSLRNVARTTSNVDIRLFSNALRNSIADRVKTEFSESSLRWLNKLIGWRRMLALVTFQRPAMELTANAIRYFMVNPTALFDNIKFSDKRWRGVINHMDSPLSLKLSRWSPEGVAGMSMEDIRARNDKKAGMAEVFKDTRKTMAERMGEWFYTFADTQMGRIVYAHEFNMAFKKQAGKNFDLKEFQENETYAKENEKAMAYADAMAFSMMEELYNSQSWITTPSKVKFIPGVMDRSTLSSKKGGWAKIFGYMQSFNFNETEQTLKYIQTLMRPGMGSDAKIEAGRKIAAFAVSNYVYMATMGAAARFISASIASALDGEDDDYWADVQEGLADYFTLEAQSKLLIGSLITLGMGRYGGVARELTSVAWGSLQTIFPDSKFVESLIAGTKMTMYVQPIDFKRRYRPDQMMDKLGGVAGDIAAEMVRMGVNVADIIKKVNEDGIAALSPDEKEFWLLMSALNQTAALVAPNFMSPLAERAIKAKTYDLTADYSVEPSLKTRTIPWAGKKIDIYEQYKLEPHRGIAGNKFVVASTGNRTGNELEITDTQKKKLQGLAQEKFDEYVKTYIQDNTTRIGSESYGAITPAMTDRMQKDMNALWTKAKSQARYETYEYPGLKSGSDYARVKKYGAIPRPIASWEENGKNILMDNSALSRRVNTEYFKLYLEMFREAYPTDGDIVRAQKNGTFDKDVNKLMSSAMAGAKGRTIK